MEENVLVRFIEHNNWANRRIIQVCKEMDAAQLNAAPATAIKGSIHQMLTHLVYSQSDYLSFLSGQQPKYEWDGPAPFSELEDSAEISGTALLELAGDPAMDWSEDVHLDDGYTIRPWAAVLQVINHAHEHREQIKSMMSQLGVTPPKIDGWNYGYDQGAVVPPAKKDG